MEAKDYCRIMDVELMGWKAKLYDVMSKMDKLPTSEKQRMYEHVNAIHIIVAELEEEIDRLRTECPTEWTPTKGKISSQMTKLGKKYESTANQLFDYDFGG